MAARCCEVVRGWGLFIVFVILALASLMMMSLCLVYLLMDRVLVVLCCCFGSSVWKMV